MIRHKMPYALALVAMLAGPAMAQETGSIPTAPNATFITEAQPGQYAASQLVGVSIYNPKDEDIGKVNELILDKQGSIAGVVIGVGGFLGIGEKNVALPYAAISWVDKAPTPSQPNAGITPPAATGPAVTPTPAPVAENTVRDYPYRGILGMTKEQLQAAPDFKFASQAAAQ